MGNYVNRKAKIYVSKNNYFTMRFTLIDETDYDADLEKYVALNSMNPSNIDVVVKSELKNATFKLNEKDKVDFKKIRKSNNGSPMLIKNRWW
ncbi:hypothetical protein CKN86_13190 [Carnobacterium divergens]|uniref:hypothetical protein n=1 Tax=Carnobacterium divergens TaxID=2748 RepID=UPI000D6DECDA|nr:hypothetical protein [Carnobacterium divergens]MCO6017198.1 hypothetical protein [Carnobacterium divergens]TFI61353.1 hypothetical protein CKN62_13330 [Carnobacterium divergens]TFI88374.1 hypothetical protein CKN84_13220 [Carnobacterium divergens]TFJ02943.1 hypothetical protein CKN86_13190 [Carnobacterium divergens]TFJ04492.1 hypothetical protein CKN65_13440 [Carnobacterium divergens]